MKQFKESNPDFFAAYTDARKIIDTGSTFTTNGNTFQVSYEGGDGNDLTLTVVP